MTGAWHVIVEEHVQQLNMVQWEVSRYFAANDHQHALALAHQTAVTHVPRHPSSPRSRQVFRMPDGSWLVHVTGTVSRWHFRVSVAEHFGTYPGVPQA